MAVWGEEERMMKLKREGKKSISATDCLVKNLVLAVK